MLLSLLLLLLLVGPLSGLQSPLLASLWRQGQRGGLTEPERAGLHLELSGLDELEARLRGAEGHTAARLSLEARDRFRGVLARYRLSPPLPGALEGTPAWSEVALGGKWCQEVWTRARQLPFSDEQLAQLLHQLRAYEGMERDLRGLSRGEADEKALALRDQRELVLSELSRETHQLVRQMGTDTWGEGEGAWDQGDREAIETEVSQLEELLGKQRELEEWALKSKPLPDTFHQVVLHNAQKVHQLTSSLSDRRRREEL